jgi:hypothetical protein
MTTKTVDPDELFAYATAFCRRNEAKDGGSDYPTLRQAANRFGVRQVDIESACDDFDSSKGYMQIAVAVGGNGGYAEYKTRGDCKVEAYV